MKITPHPTTFDAPLDFGVFTRAGAPLDRRQVQQSIERMWLTAAARGMSPFLTAAIGLAERQSQLRRIAGAVKPISHASAKDGGKTGGQAFRCRGGYWIH
ncbi:hypothetical protein [Planctomyces sp. SH-PL14]|uniref:hypothetical protein n=1 Tax=Planctomyces sp. SH-PL14 TaxID=1632864 RepID=UPI00078E9FE1|nr:hypothetical protein [Planctomyces sp. SH-PL14]AMV18276.1 hypothetical protein VT03_10330 [Planctomyces sp. SH-PL14]